MKDEFYIVLPSNSSMKYYPDNTTTRYTTYLPQCVSLHGKWSVSLAEIHIPMTFLHVPGDGEQNFINIATFAEDPDIDSGIDFRNERISVPSGVYRNIDTLLKTINELPGVRGCFNFYYGSNGYVVTTCVCIECENTEHSFHFSSALNKILGYTHSSGIVVQKASSYIAHCPANLTNAIPDMLFIYTDICEPYITGDVHTPLLRVVPSSVDDNYNYGSMKIKSFSPFRYVPLLRTSFQTITIDIRDEFGDAIPFENGTLTVTLHFRRSD